MDVRQLRHFAAVAETLHFGRAAQKLGMTQPPLSQSIQALEQELGAPLFARSKRSVALTPFGEQWLVPVRAVLAELGELPGIARRLRDGDAGRLELSFVSTADYSILPALVRRFAGLYPAVELALTEATSDVQIEDLVEGRGHAGIIIPPPGGLLPQPLSYRPLVTEPLVAAVPEIWIEEGRLPPAAVALTPAAVIGAPLIIFPRRSAPAFYDLVTGYFTAHGGKARVSQEAVQMQTIISLVSAGMGLALVPASLRHLARTGVRYLPLAGEAPTLETGLAWRRDDATPTLERFLNVAWEVAAG
jgi:DNA-binding transcriptional LysR family regulator